MELRNVLERVRDRQPFFAELIGDNGFNLLLGRLQYLDGFACLTTQLWRSQRSLCRLESGSARCIGKN